MENTKILLVGGTFDYAGGKPSGLVEKMSAVLNSTFLEPTYYNGGFVDELHSQILPQAAAHDIVIWMPNVPNDAPKMRNVKEINPKTILISSKRNDNNKYAFSELINRALMQKSNLVIQFSKGEAGFDMMVFDPLGTCYYNGNDINEMVCQLMKRAVELTRFTRVGSVQAPGVAPEVPDEENFFVIARKWSDIFHNLINPDAGVARFLGNMSFRCQNGFPSFRGKDNMIYVSRRNVDKRFINKDSFVPTYMGTNGAVCYYGDNKPSVDTPIQQRLYELYPRMNYMLHAHCYINYVNERGQATPYTYNPVPCGAIEEVDEIMKVMKRCFNPDEDDLITINLIGHGCFLMATSVEQFEKLANIKDQCFFSRPMPENIVENFLHKYCPKDANVQRCQFTLNTLSEYITKGYTVSFEEFYFCCKGSMVTCWSEPYRDGLGYLTKAKVEESLSKRIHKAMSHECYDRFFMEECADRIIIYMITRDILTFDCVIVLKKPNGGTE